MFEINEIKMPQWRWTVRDNHSCHLPCIYRSINIQKFLPLLYWFSPTALPASYILTTPLTFLLIVLYVCEIGPFFPKKKDLSKKQKNERSDHTTVDISALHQKIINQINKKRNTNYKNRYQSKEKCRKCYFLWHISGTMYLTYPLSEYKATKIFEPSKNQI